MSQYDSCDTKLKQGDRTLGSDSGAGGPLVPAVLKVGGRTLLAAGGRLDASRIQRRVRVIARALVPGRRLAVVVGGGGSHLFVEPARACGVSDGACDTIGMVVCRIAAEILLCALRQHTQQVYERVAASLGEVDAALSMREAVVIACLPGSAASQDSTAAIVAEHLKADCLVFLKSYDLAQSMHVRPIGGRGVATVYFRDLVEQAWRLSESAAQRPLIDVMALRVIQRTLFRTYFLAERYFAQFPPWLIANRPATITELTRSSFQAQHAAGTRRLKGVE